MGAGFIRRYSSAVGLETIRTIEGVTILDLPPPGSIQGISTGVVAAVGEFADMTYAVSVATTGAVTSKYRPVEIFSAQDLIDKMGGFDETLGAFGTDDGNGFTLLRNKSFARLVCVPINMAATYACRFFRVLPTNTSITNPTPVVPLVSAKIAAGRQFAQSTNKLRIAMQPIFTADAAFNSGTDGSVNVASPGIFTAAGGDFTGVTTSSKTVYIGDMVVVGVIGDGGVNGSNAGTYRVRTVDSATQLTLETLAGALVTWTTGASLAWRIHPASTGDTAPRGYALTGAAGYTVAVRPLATVASAQALAPSTVPSAATANSWDPLSGLAGASHPSQAITYDANIHAINLASNSTVATQYSNALDSLISQDDPARDVNIVIAARTSSTIRTLLKTHVLNASTNGLGRVACIAPGLGSVTTSAVTATADPGVGANRAERIIYCWPGVRTFVPEANGYSLTGADTATHSDGILDTRADGWMASILSNLAPERNPGQASDPVPRVMAPILGLQRSAPTLGLNDYILLRQAGVCGVRMDRDAGPIFQSGITTSTTSGEKNINRRRMADFIQDSLAQRYNQFAKQPLTQQLKDALLGETDNFLLNLLSPGNPALQRINAYQVDGVSGNTPDMEAQGVYVVIVRVRTTPTADFIVLQAEVGESVVISQLP